MRLSAWDWLALLLWPLVAGLLGWQAAPLSGIKLACAAGAASGILLHCSLRHLSIRLPALWLGSAAACGLVTLLQKLLLDWEAPSRMLGPNRLFLLSQSLSWLSGWALLLLALRWSSSRLRVFVVLEGVLAATSIVWIFSGHRDGFINRPFFLVDRLWAQGYDPLPVFLFLGVLCALMVGCLAASHHRGRRTLWDLPLMMLLLVGVFLLLPPTAIKQWSEKYGMGNGQGKDQRYSEKQKKDKQGKGSGKGTSGDASPSPNGDKGQGSEQEPSFSDQSSESKNPPVAVVIFRDDYAPEGGYYYFRQTAFSEYNGIKLVRSSNSAFDNDNATGFPTYSQQEKPFGETLGVEPLHWDESAFQRLPTRVALMGQQARPFGLSNPVRFWACENPDPSRFQKAYEVESLALTLPYLSMVGRKAGDPAWSRETWQHYIEGPKDKRYSEMVDTILASVRPEFKRDGFHKAIAIKLWLDDNCTYSLHSRHENSDDPVSDFLFGDRTGYCVFTSHAACYLFRAAGIPARIAEGFAVPAQSKGNGSSLLVHSKEAHSWPEIYLDGLGWLALDIAPKKNLEPPGDPVDSGLQNMLGDMARKDKEHRAPDQPKETIDLRELLRQLLLQMASTLPLSGLITLAFLLLVKLYRRFSPNFPWLDSRELAISSYRSALDSLCDHGFVRKTGDSREEFARQACTLCPSVMPLTRLHLAARLGTRDIEATELRQAFGAVRSELRQTPKGWRYWLRLFNPVSWWRVN